MNRSPENYVELIGGVLPIVVVALGALVVVPQFQKMFANFGADLPLITRILLATFRWWTIIAVIPFALWAAWPDRSMRGVLAVSAGIVCAMLLFFGGLYACYAPILGLAAVVD